MIKKNILLITSGILAGFAIVMGSFEPFRLCGDSWRNCMSINYDIDLVLIPIIPLFLFSLITYFMRDDVYRVWARFSYIWVPISMVLIFLAPEYSSSFIYPITKGSVAFISSLLFTLISLILIIWKYFATRRSNTRLS